ncbi:MAG: copper amine oxidase N-terminal domain-containing protein [Peptostreptococcaceae bacterium]|nr:copper amine oxidase N-terminal domain-containing protein [Peptostreptococcaceae bacterium]
MNRFKQMMALTAACVITTMTVSAGTNAYAIERETVGKNEVVVMMDQKNSPVEVSEDVKKKLITQSSELWEDAQGSGGSRLDVARETKANIAKAEILPENSQFKGSRNKVLEITMKEEGNLHTENADKLKELFLIKTDKIEKRQKMNSHPTVATVLLSGNKIQLYLNDPGVFYGEEITVSYVGDDNLLTQNKKDVKSFIDIPVNTENVQPVATVRVNSINKVTLENGQTTTSKIRVEFSEVLPLEVEDIIITNAKVKSGTLPKLLQGNIDAGNVIYDIEIDNVTSKDLMVKFEKLGFKITPEKEIQVKVDYEPTSKDSDDNSGPGGQKPQPQPQPQAPSTGGGSSRSSVRPNSDSKSDDKKSDVKKDEMKKDEMSNTAKSAEKVSTKLVIGQKTYTAMINGQAVQKTADVAPQVHQGRTVLPARMISELLGVDVKFDQKSKTASFMYGEGNKVELTLGQKFMMVNGEKVALTADILNKDGRILLPVTDIQKAFAKLGLTANVSWDAATKSVTIEK